MSEEYQNMPTWAELISQAKQLTVDEMRRHAHVSIDNRHKCKSCFCCACLEALKWIEEFSRAHPVSDVAQRYKPWQFSQPLKGKL